jgi:hypothetical protein
MLGQGILTQGDGSVQLTSLFLLVAFSLKKYFSFYTNQSYLCDGVNYS